MRVSCEAITTRPVKSDLLCLPVFQDGFSDSIVKQIDAELDGYLGALKKRKRFEGKKLEKVSHFPHPEKALREVMFIGLGKRSDADLDTLRKAGGLAGKRATDESIRDVAVVVPDLKKTTLKPALAVRAVVEGVNLGSYFLDKFKSERKKAKPRQLKLLVPSRSSLIHLNSAAELGYTISEMQCEARNLSAYPASIMTPSFLAKEARRLVKGGGVKVTSMGKAQIEKLKMGAFLAVAQGSTEPPRLIQIEYRPKGKASKHVFLVGKGVTFDTGGLSLKSPQGMVEMKQDMTGAAVAIATMGALARLKPRVAVTMLVPSCENMPDAKAFKPGDIVTACTGKTIEVLNTDAEGRLLLADALGYASKQKPDYLVDVATLTGATKYALGHVAAPFMTTEDSLAAKFEEASRVSGEKVWRLPLWDEYRKQIDSDLADMKNTGGAPAGTITAAMLLKEFTADIPWLHLDIAAVDMQYQSAEYIPKGASGFGVRVLTEFLCSL